MRFRTLVSAITLAAAAFAQSPSFEVASVKPSTAPDYRNTRTTLSGGPGTADPGRWSCDHISLSGLVRFAYNLREFDYAGPSWMDSAFFAITAKVPTPATRDDLRVMVQRLLAERFRMSVRREKKEVSGYALILDKGGPRFRESPPLAPGEPEIPSMPAERPRISLGPDGYPDIAPGLNVVMTLGVRARSQHVRETMDGFIGHLAGLVAKPVIDATGLKGKYDLSVYWIYERPGAPLPPPPSPDRPPLNPAEDTNGPTIFQAVQEQLGLKLDARKVTIDFLTVESAERTPIEN